MSYEQEYRPHIDLYWVVPNSVHWVLDWIRGHFRGAAMSNFYLNADSDNESVIVNIGRFIRGLDPRKKWHIIIKPFKDLRSLRQNKYMFGVVYKTIRDHVEAQGDEVYSIDDIHEWMKSKHAVPKVKLVQGDEVKVYKSTADMSKAEFSEYLERIFLQMAQQGCVIPPPDWNHNERKAA